MKTAVFISITVISVIFLLWFLSPLLFGIKNIGMLFGVIICSALIFRFGFSGLYEKLKTTLCAATPGTILVRIVQIGASLFLVYAMIVSACMIYAMCVKPGASDTAVVLGAQVKPWGPSTLLRQRIDAAERYLKDEPEADAVLTGGKGDDEIMSEAQCMYEHLVDAGIEPERLNREDQAINTEQNMRYSLAIIREKDLDPDIAVITDSYHQLRARIIASKIDSSVKISAVNTKNGHIGISAYPSYFVREWIAVPVEIMKRYHR